MSQRGVFVLAALLFGLVGAFGCYSVQEQPPRYGLGVSVEQSESEDGVLCRFAFTNADTGEVISSPTVLAQWNEPAEITQTTESDVLTISILANRVEQTVAYTAMLTAGEKVQFEKKEEVRVAPAAS